MKKNQNNFYKKIKVKNAKFKIKMYKKKFKEIESQSSIHDKTKINVKQKCNSVWPNQIQMKQMSIKLENQSIDNQIIMQTIQFQITKSSK